MRSDRSPMLAQTVLFAILLLFFLQVLTDFIESIYAFALLVTAFTPQVAAMLLMFSPVALLFVRRTPSRAWLLGLSATAILGTLGEPFMAPALRLVACGLSVGAFMLLFPLLASVQPKGAISGWRSAAALLIASAFMVFVRTANSGVSWSEAGIYTIGMWVLAAVAGRLLWTLELGRAVPGEMNPVRKPEIKGVEKQPLSHDERRAESLRALSERPAVAEAIEPVVPAESKGPSSGRVAGLCIGLSGVILMIYFALGAPAVIARWTGSSYIAIVTVLVAAMAGLAIMLASGIPRGVLNRPVLLAWNTLFVVMLVEAILPHQILFPAHPGAYPFDAPRVTPLAQIPLYAMLLLSPVVFVDFLVYVREISAEGPTIQQLGGGFALGALILLAMVFLQVFTTTYDYVGPIGPLLRDRFWLVFLLAGLVLMVPVLLVREKSEAETEPKVPGRFTALTVSALAVLAIASAALTAPRPEDPPARVTGLSIMTYNIQQGFDAAGAKDLHGQLAAMRRVGPGILGLEESDTARVGSGNVDAVRYFADHLGMYSYYGPTTTTGTFGIALLSKFPIENPRTFFLYSRGEQTAAIQAEVDVNGKRYNVFVTHLGNDGPMIQMQGVMQRAQGLPNVIMMGDFNFDPSTEQYGEITRVFSDAWLLRWPGGYQRHPFGAAGRIDQIFISPGMQVLEAEYVPDPASDHPFLYAILKP